MHGAAGTDVSGTDAVGRNVVFPFQAVMLATPAVMVMPLQVEFSPPQLPAGMER